MQEQRKPNPVEIQPKRALPAIRMARPAFIRQRQLKAAMAAATPAQTPQAHPSVKAVHFGDVPAGTANPDDARPATVAVIGDPLFGLNGPVVAAHGVVGSAGIGEGFRKGSTAGVFGMVASAGVSGSAETGKSDRSGDVSSAGIRTVPLASAAALQIAIESQSTALEVLSKPPVRYTPEAKWMRV